MLSVISKLREPSVFVDIVIQEISCSVVKIALIFEMYLEDV